MFYEMYCKRCTTIIRSKGLLCDETYCIRCTTTTMLYFTVYRVHKLIHFLSRHIKRFLFVFITQFLLSVKQHVASALSVIIDNGI